MKKTIICFCVLVLIFGVGFAAFADVAPYNPQTYYYKVRVGGEAIHCYRENKTGSGTFKMEAGESIKAGSTLEILYETTSDGVRYGAFDIQKYWDELDPGPLIIGEYSIDVTDADTGESHSELIQIYGTKNHTSIYRFVRLFDVQRLDDNGNVVLNTTTNENTAVTVAETKTTAAATATAAASTVTQTSEMETTADNAETTAEETQSESGTDDTQTAADETSVTEKTPTTETTDQTAAVHRPGKIIGVCVAAAVVLTLTAVATLALIRRKKAS